jgi:hypothetical protein
VFARGATCRSKEALRISAASSGLGLLRACKGFLPPTGTSRRPSTTPAVERSGALVKARNADSGAVRGPQGPPWIGCHRSMPTRTATRQQLVT